MKRINYAAQRSDLFQNIITSIKTMLVENNLDSISLEDKEDKYLGYIIRSGNQLEEVLVTEVKLDGDSILYKAKENTDDQWSDLEEDVVADNVDMLYDAVYDKISDMNNVS